MTLRLVGPGLLAAALLLAGAAACSAGGESDPDRPSGHGAGSQEPTVASVVAATVIGRSVRAQQASGLHVVTSVAVESILGGGRPAPAPPPADDVVPAPPADRPARQ